ncbi:hypothetical protein [Streptomyces sp. NPDC127098]|uniref:hypothetical protein n=1 Tax=Streptomyces sp. NPDC127098 TaxID=3347137 RepID=UPI0036500C81
MHPDAHLAIHRLGAHQPRPPHHPVRRPRAVRATVRARVGWALVEAGLRLVSVRGSVAEDISR